MSAAFDALAAVRDHLKASLPGIKTARIGFEANMTPDDYPMVRIVPSVLSNGLTLQRRQVGALVYFGRPIFEFSGESSDPETTGLEELWSELLGMEAEILALLRTTPGHPMAKYIRTVLDEDRNDAYKLMCLMVEISG